MKSLKSISHEWLNAARWISLLFGIFILENVYNLFLPLLVL